MRPYAALLALSAASLLTIFPCSALAADTQTGKTDKNAPQTAPVKTPASAFPADSSTQGSVTVEGHLIHYRAIVGTLVVGSKDAQDAAMGAGTPANPEDKDAPATARMSYVAYFEEDARPETRPITFIYNGGPGSSTVWLHMGAWGPRRVVTADDQHTAPAPYQIVDNSYSLLDASDLVFVDAPGTGFGRLYGKDKEKAFWGVDQDANAFARFVVRFLSQYQRWNSPKFLFGESYGTTRSAVLANILESQDNIDLNGVILLSQILNFDDNADTPQYNPGVDLPYVLALPSYTATAYYHHRLPNQPKDMRPLLQEVEHFALAEYAPALAQGAKLPTEERQSVAAHLHDYTGLPTAYILKADLRVNVGMFNHVLQGDDDVTTGRLDGRFSGPSMDPLSKESHYDPQSAAISSAYVAAFNDYVRRVLKFGDGLTYQPELDSIGDKWEMKHKVPGSGNDGLQSNVNVMPDLADAMKYNPRLKVMLNCGYYDLATPYYAALYEMDHLPVPPGLRANIQTEFYNSGHMVYAHLPSLKQLHDNVAAFIRGAYVPVNP